MTNSIGILWGYVLQDKKKYRDILEMLFLLKNQHALKIHCLLQGKQKSTMLLSEQKPIAVKTDCLKLISKQTMNPLEFSYLMHRQPKQLQQFPLA
jgi:hypothetical protein